MREETSELTTELALKAGLQRVNGFSGEPIWVGTQSKIEAFALSVALVEREDCARLCENLERQPSSVDDWDIATLDCADAIRKDD